MSYITEQLTEAAAAIEAAMAETDFQHTHHWLSLRDSVVGPLNRIRAELLLAEHDDRRRRMDADG